jgi:ubiquinone/menaquinone biosynthesis C-methylase UbiE/GGDEF domain-containing protein
MLSWQSSRFRSTFKIISIIVIEIFILSNFPIPLNEFTPLEKVHSVVKDSVEGLNIRSLAGLPSPLKAKAESRQLNSVFCQEAPNSYLVPPLLSGGQAQSARKRVIEEARVLAEGTPTKSSFIASAQSFHISGTQRKDNYGDGNAIKIRDSSGGDSIISMDGGASVFNLVPEIMKQATQRYAQGLNDGERITLTVEGEYLPETKIRFVVREIKGRTFLIQAEIITKTQGAIITGLENALAQADLSEPPSDKPYVIAMVKSSPRLFGNCLGDGFIYINEAFFKLHTISKKYLLQVGLEHELYHEALVFERAVLARMLHVDKEDITELTLKAGIGSYTFTYKLKGDGTEQTTEIRADEMLDKFQGKLDSFQDKVESLHRQNDIERLVEIAEEKEETRINIFLELRQLNKSGVITLNFLEEASRFALRHVYSFNYAKTEMEKLATAGKDFTAVVFDGDAIKKRNDALGKKIVDWMIYEMACNFADIASMLKKEPDSLNMVPFRRGGDEFGSVFESDGLSETDIRVILDIARLSLPHRIRKTYGAFYLFPEDPLYKGREDEIMNVLQELDDRGVIAAFDRVGERISVLYIKDRLEELDEAFKQLGYREGVFSVISEELSEVAVLTGSMGALYVDGKMRSAIEQTGRSLNADTFMAGANIALSEAKKISQAPQLYERKKGDRNHVFSYFEGLDVNSWFHEWGNIMPGLRSLSAIFTNSADQDTIEQDIKQNSYSLPFGDRDTVVPCVLNYQALRGKIDYDRKMERDSAGRLIALDIQWGDFRALIDKPGTFAEAVQREEKLGNIHKGAYLRGFYKFGMLNEELPGHMFDADWAIRIFGYLINMEVEKLFGSDFEIEIARAPPGQSPDRFYAWVKLRRDSQIKPEALDEYLKTQLPTLLNIIERTLQKYTLFGSNLALYQAKAASLQATVVPIQQEIGMTYEVIDRLSPIPVEDREDEIDPEASREFYEARLMRDEDVMVTEDGHRIVFYNEENKQQKPAMAKFEELKRINALKALLEAMPQEVEDYSLTLKVLYISVLMGSGFEGRDFTFEELTRRIIPATVNYDLSVFNKTIATILRDIKAKRTFELEAAISKPAEAPKDYLANPQKDLSRIYEKIVSAKNMPTAAVTAQATSAIDREAPLIVTQDYKYGSVEEIVELLGLSKHDDVLDIGCGTGFISIGIADRVANITGIDNAGNISLAERIARYSKHPRVKAAINGDETVDMDSLISEIELENAETSRAPNLQFFAGGAEDMSMFGDNSFTKAIYRDVHNFILSDKRSIAIDEILRIMKEGGFIYARSRVGATDEDANRLWGEFEERASKQNIKLEKVSLIKGVVVIKIVSKEIKGYSTSPLASLVMVGPIAKGVAEEIPDLSNLIKAVGNAEKTEIKETGQTIAISFNTLSLSYKGGSTYAMFDVIEALTLARALGNKLVVFSQTETVTKQEIIESLRAIGAPETLLGEIDIRAGKEARSIDTNKLSALISNSDDYIDIQNKLGSTEEVEYGILLNHGIALDQIPSLLKGISYLMALNGTLKVENKDTFILNLIGPVIGGQIPNYATTLEVADKIREKL